MKNKNTTTDVLQEIHDKISVINYRVAVYPVEFSDLESRGGILIPKFIARNSTYRYGRVVRSGSKSKLDLKIGDLVIYQMTVAYEAGLTHKVVTKDGMDRFVTLIHWGDAIGKVTDVEKGLNLENFAILGNFLLINKTNSDRLIGGIYIPDTATVIPNFHLVQKGCNVDKDAEGPDFVGLKPGDEVFPDRSRATEIAVGEKEYLFIDRINIHGYRTA